MSGDFLAIDGPRAAAPDLIGEAGSEGVSMIELILAAGAVLQKAPVVSEDLAKRAPARACVEVPEPIETGARALQWYVDGDAVPVGGETFVKYGLPRVLGASEVEFYRASRGGYFYAEAGLEGKPEVVYLLVDLAGCEFQPYQLEFDA